MKFEDGVVSECHRCGNEKRRYPVDFGASTLWMCVECINVVKNLEVPKEPRFKIEHVGTVGYRVIDTDDVDNEAVVEVTVKKLSHGYGTTFLPTKEQAEAICKVANEVWG